MALVVVKCIVRAPPWHLSKKKAVWASLAEVAAFTRGSIYYAFTLNRLKLPSPEQTRKGNFEMSKPGMGSIEYLFWFFESESCRHLMTCQSCTMKRCDGLAYTAIFAGAYSHIA